MSTRVIVLGGSGMLGSMVVDYLSRDPDLRLTATVRTGTQAAGGAARLGGVSWRQFDAGGPDVWGALGVIAGHDWVINAIGITKPLIRDDHAAEVERAIQVNASLPHLLARRAQADGVRVVQIATDCVYSGRKGGYVEGDEHDALDVYGKTKSLGETHGSHVHHLRCSIIGPEPKEHKFLLDWFLTQPRQGRVKGFVNHRWNGVTTLHFAKLCHGLVTRDLPMPHVQHVIPTGAVTKCELLECFARHYDRPDVAIIPAEALEVVDRTLATADEASNRQLWRSAGYTQAPTVPEMIGELARCDYRFRPVQRAGAETSAS